MTFLQPLFVAGAGLIVTWVGTKVPGANLDGTELAGLFAVGAASAASAVWKWLENRGKHEVAVSQAAAAAAISPGPPSSLEWDAKTQSYRVGEAGKRER